MMFSVVIPVYNCKHCLVELCNKINKVMCNITDNFEVIMVDDASPDNSWLLIESLAKGNSNIKGILLSRNFGQHNAISAGLNCAIGDYVVIMDCDLQDNPDEIINLYNKLLDGFDYVSAKRIARQDSFVRKIGSYFFSKMFNALAEFGHDHTVANFAIYSQKIIRNYVLIKEQVSPLSTFIQWMGFQGATIEVQHSVRHQGNSSYTFNKLLKWAIASLISHSNKPLIYSIKLGGGLALISFFYGFFVAAQYFVYGIPVEGWTSLIISIYLLGGLILIQLGILGLYIARIFDEVKNRPAYLVSKTVGMKNGYEDSI